MATESVAVVEEEDEGIVSFSIKSMDVCTCRLCSRCEFVEGDVRFDLVFIGIPNFSKMLF